VIQRPVDGDSIALFPTIKLIVEPVHGFHDGPAVAVVAFLEALLVFGIRPDGAEHGIQGETHEQGDGHGEGHNHGEGVEEAPHDAAHEGHRHEHGQQGKGGRDDRRADFRRAFAGRGDVILAHFRMTRDVFAHHDGVIDQDADGQG